MEIDSEVPFSSGFSLKQSGRVELRGSKLYKTCDCVKRNGLQMDCRRTECIGRPSYGHVTPSYNQGSSARRMPNYVMEMETRNGGYGNYNQYQYMDPSNMPSYSNMPDYNLRGLTAPCTMGGFGDGNNALAGGPGIMNYNTNYGRLSDNSSQFTIQPHATPYENCMLSNETAGMDPYSGYGSSNMQSQEMQYGDYIQG